MDIEKKNKGQREAEEIDLHPGKGAAEYERRGDGNGGQTGVKNSGRETKTSSKDSKSSRAAGGTKVREKEYYEILYGELKKLAGEDVDISMRDVRKNNGVYKKACTVRFNDAQIAPTVYLEPYYDHYLHGEAVSESADNILRYCKCKTPGITFPDNFFREYGTVCGRLGFKLIGKKRNEAFLQDVPHIDFEDMAAVFYYLLENPEFGNGMIIVRNMDMKRWGKTAEELYQDAVENCPRMLPPVFRMLSDVLEVLQPAGEGELYLLTNESALYGAAVILYPGLLQEVADYIGGDYFVLPSSVHEVILLPDNGEEAEDLLHIVTEINHTQVAEEEILIDAVYKYTSGDDFIHREA